MSIKGKILLAVGLFFTGFGILLIGDAATDIIQYLNDKRIWEYRFPLHVLPFTLIGIVNFVLGIVILTEPNQKDHPTFYKKSKRRLLCI